MVESDQPPLLDSTPLNSPHFVIGAVDLPAVGLPVIIALVPAGIRGVWLVTGKPGKVTREVAATALAICVLQRSYPMFLGTLNPSAERLPFVAIGSNCEWTDHRRLRYPVQVREAVRQLRDNHLQDIEQLVGEMHIALNGKRPLGWSPVPPEFGVLDPDNSLGILPSSPFDNFDESLLQVSFETLGTLVKYDYERSRYLEHLTTEELTSRASEALLNTYELAGAGHWSIDPFDPVQGRAFARLEEAAHEAELRTPGAWKTIVEAAVPLGLKIGPEADWSNAFRYFETAPTTSIPDLARFGLSNHLKRSISEGVFRLSPASSFADSYLGSARFDTELVSIEEIKTKTAKFTIRDPDGDSETPLQPLRATRKSHSSTDTLLLCFSKRVSPRLFQDFGADACLQIHDRAEFLTRLRAATARDLPGWRLWSGDVQYYDPYSRRAAYSVPLYCKTIGYAYQQEFRVMWIPPQNRERLDPNWITIGSIEDISELTLL